MNIEIKDMDQLYILREGLSSLNGENNFAVSILEKVSENDEHAKKELDQVLLKRKYIDDLIEQTDKLIGENRPIVNYVSYKDLKKARD